MAADRTSHLTYLSGLANQLGVTDPVESYLAPVVGRWSELRAEAERWRAAGQAVEDVTGDLTKQLGGLDRAWRGRDAESFVDYMQRLGLAGRDLQDAANAMADALDQTATGISQVVDRLTDLLADAAERTSAAMALPVRGETRVRQYLTELEQPTGRLYESVGTILQAFTRMCDGMAGEEFAAITMPHKVPAQPWAPADQQPKKSKFEQAKPKPAPKPAPPPAPSPPARPSPAATPAPAPGTAPSGAAPGPAPVAAPAPAAGAPVAASIGEPARSGAVAEELLEQPAGGAATAVAAGESGSAAAGGFAPMMGGTGGAAGGQSEHKPKTRVMGDINDVLGTPDRTIPETIGED